MGCVRHGSDKTVANWRREGRRRLYPLEILLGGRNWEEREHASVSYRYRNHANSFNGILGNVHHAHARSVYIPFALLKSYKTNLGSLTS